jgi:ABC-type Mn2+/Zn2+ transport system ATPase subunit
MNLDNSFPILTKEFIRIYNEKAKISDIEDLLEKFNSKDILNRKIDKLS